MLKIGQFSKLSQVTVKTLHHYDEIDLLKPAKIDPFTNYRYYSVDQLPRLHRIIALKELGLSLEQIGSMLNQDVPLEQIRGMLRLKQAESQQRIREEQERLQQIEFRLNLIDMEGHMPDLDVVIKEIPDVYALTLRRSFTPEKMIPFGLEIDEAFETYNVQQIGPTMEIRYEDEFKPAHDDVEFAFPVATSHLTEVPLETAGIFRPRHISGLSMVASYIIKGINPEQIPETMPLFRRWIVDNGYQLCASHRLVFHNGPREHAEYENWIVEFQHEVALAEAE